MNEQNIFEGCPNGDAWIACADAVKREWASRVISRSLDEIATLGKEPDEWEATMLGNAIGALAMRFYSLAVTNVNLAMAPKSQRSPAAILDQFTLAQLEAGFQVAIVRSSIHN